MLEAYPWWLNRLTESVVGQAKLGDGGRRTQRVMHGDDELASHIGLLPKCRCPEDEDCTCDLATARRKRHRAQLRKAAGTGRVSEGAAELHEDAANVLGTWVRHLIESRGVSIAEAFGIELQPVAPIGFIGPLLPGWVRTRPDVYISSVRMARWLHANISAIANDEAAGEIFDELTDTRRRIERMVNRAQPRKMLGKCPTWIEETGHACGRELSAPEDATEIRCRDCGEKHQCNRLQLLLTMDSNREQITMARVREINRRLPQEFRIAERTMRRWVAEKRLRPKGHDDAGEPLYLWADVRRLNARDDAVARSG
jgi:hypothetical protein